AAFMESSVATAGRPGHAVHAECRAPLDAGLSVADPPAHEAEQAEPGRCAPRSAPGKATTSHRRGETGRDAEWGQAIVRGAVVSATPRPLGRPGLRPCL